MACSNCHAIVALRQVQILGRCLLRFLDESMEQHHPALLVDIEKHARNSVLGQARPHFIDAIAQWFANGHANGQPNSTVLISSPMRFRSSGGNPFNHSRTGSPLASVRVLSERL
jgi:hypothetical protein